MQGKKRQGKPDRHQLPAPPKRYRDFVSRYPGLGAAWELIGEAGREGPLDQRACRLIKLAIAIGAMREGAVHANVRKALATGLRREEIEQIVALAAGTLGLPSTVTISTWVQDLLGKKGGRTGG